MNIFALNEDPNLAAEDCCDKHVVKMPIECAQMASMVLDTNYMEQYRGSVNSPSAQLGLPQYPKAHLKHPSTLWAMESRSNYMWLVKHMRALLRQYTLRYNKVHSMDSLPMIYEAQCKFLKFDKQQLTKFAIAIANQELHDDDPVIAYRNYYNIEKSRFAKWKSGRIPTWYAPGKLVTT